MKTKPPLLKKINHYGKTLYIPNHTFEGGEHRTPVDWSKSRSENWATRQAPDNITQPAPAGVNPKRVHNKTTIARPVSSPSQPVSVAAVKPASVRRKVVGSKQPAPFGKVTK